LSKHVGVGLIGAGEISIEHAKGYAARGDAKIIAIADTNVAAAKSASERYGAEKYYSDFHQLVLDPKVDMVDICIPHSLHAQAAIAAAEAGKHVLVQKPMAISLEECDQMIRAARKAGVKLMVNHNQIFYPPYQELRKLITSGVLGQIRILRARLGVGGKLSGWRADPKITGGGILFDSGVHRFYTSRFLIGDVKSVQAFADKKNPREEGEDIATVLLKFEGPSYGIIDASYFDPPNVYDDVIEAYGNLGIAKVPGCEGFWTGFVSGSPLQVYRDGKWTQRSDLESDWSKTIQYGIHHFLDSVINDSEPPIPGEEGRRIVEIILACYESVRREKTIDL
jgi:predicted dehydrogenase